ncbi:non-ribosomal peptide synthetase [Cupriavidus gilardii]|uniref:Amino acid adenylation domain-containing protein n=4 Tax=Cupriavidus gilardii TaxID=82541 RepID=A0A849B8D5_9BURK|nr:non-ribosomal peptide synthetase [Cupriavidus gilardii]KAB0596434.1 amino acid adenylation domain-containing protein [Cupriavidus gilardii]NNH10035.1 amino acid adenylation domain-containing protein [Cupriavidus gilardii]
MNDQQASRELIRRFVGLPPEKRKILLERLGQQGISLSVLPITSDWRPATSDLPLSAAQQRMWFLWKLDPAGSAYHLAGMLRLRGQVDDGALQRTFDALVERHESLRTTFHQDGEQAVQRIHPPASPPIAVSDLRDIDPTQRDAAVQSLVDAEAQGPFDLEQGPLLRVRLLRLADDDHILLVTMHHIVSDGWSMNVVIDEFARLYAGFVSGQPPQLAPLPIQYADYAAWQKQWLEAGELERQLRYWKSHLADDGTVVLELPTDRPRPAVPSHRGGAVAFSLDPDLSAELRALARRADTTLFTVLLAAFQVLLYRYTGQRDLRVGVPVANRNRVETEGVVGFFVNTQVLRTEIEGSMTFDSVLERARESVLQAQAHQELPFEQLVEALQPERNLSHNPLFQVMLNHQRRDLRALDRLPGLVLEKVERTANAAKVDLALDTQEGEQGLLHGVFGYAADLFEHDTVERLQRHFVGVLKQVVTRPQGRIGELDLLDIDEQGQWRDWNTPNRRFSSAEPVHVAIARQATQRPDAIAIRCGGDALSYGELDAAATRLAYALHAAGARPETVVGVVLDRSPELIVRLLATLKAGAAYLPLDPELPAARLAQLLQDAGVTLVLTSRALIGRFDTDLPLVVMDDIGDPAPIQLPAVDPRQLAYLIYTSGSTGTPKGVAVEHGPLAMHCHATVEQYGMGPDDRELHFLSFNFDGAHERWLVPLIAGAQLVLRDDTLWSAEQTLEVIAREGVTNAGFPPAYLLRLAEAATEPVPLRLLSFGGEAMSREAFTRIKQKFQAGTLINGYGPTEAVVTPLAWASQHDTDCASAYVPIGRPVGDRTAYVLDADLNPVPVGVAGELYIGGLGLARGYVGKPGLTAERFVPDPFTTGARMYRTGDLVRRCRDGSIEYVGRLDHQVKIRGYRIELGEIEARLRAHATVREAVVLAHDGPIGKQLVAYVVARQDATDLCAELRAYLEGCLPTYMVPAHLIVLDRLPITANGKLDRRALPEPVWEAKGYVAPRNDIETLLAEVWQEVLGVERVGIADNFFELGGDSILSIQAVSRARRVGLRFTPKDLFLHQTVQALAQVAARDEARQAIDDTPTGEVPLLPIQQAFFETSMPQRHHWNQSVLLHPRTPLDHEALQHALREVTRHHDALRLRYRQTEGEWSQHYAEPVESELLWREDVAGVDAIDEHCTRAQQSLDLQHGPLLRALQLRLPDGSERLLLAVHHLVIDGVSWRVLLEDLQHAYRLARDGVSIALPPKTASYKAWAQALAQHANSDDLIRQADYWRTQQGPELPCDRAAENDRIADAARLTLQLSPAQTQRLLKQAPAAYRTQINDLLLSALARAVGHWAGVDRAAIFLEGHGRDALFENVDISRTVGWFTSLFPVVLPVLDDTGGSIKAVKETLRGIPDHGISYGLLRHLGPQAIRDQLAALRPPRITFNYLGQLDAGAGDAALFDRAAESPGQPISPEAPLGNWITINGQVTGGVLSLAVSFSTARYRHDTIASLVEAYREALETTIDHCVSVPPGALTPSDVPLAGLTQDQLDRLDGRQIEDLYPLTPMQHGMLFHSLYAPEAGLYVNQLAITLDGLDADRFGAAWDDTVARHEILRTGFVWIEGQAMQAVYRQVPSPVRIDAQQHWNESECEDVALAERKQAFSLDTPPLMRVRLLRLGANRYRMIWTSHHLLLDGWSTARLIGEVLQRYHGQPVEAPASRYRDHIAWLQTHDVAASESFWRQRLQTLDEPTRLASALPAPDAGIGHAACRTSLDADALARLQRSAASQHLTLNTLLQAAWVIVLQRYIGRRAVAFGATVAGRPAALPGAEAMLGLFINTLPVIQAPAPDQSVADWLQALQAENLALREHEHVPLYEIQRWAGQGGQALFDSILVFENYPVDAALRQREQNGLKLGEVSHAATTNYPLTLVVSAGATLDIGCSYQCDLFTHAAVQQLQRHYLAVLEQIASAPHARVGELRFASGDDGMLVGESPGTEATDVQTAAADVLTAWRRSVVADPSAIALRYEEQTLTRGETDRLANGIAAGLVERSVGREMRVGLCVERSPAFVTGLLGILKAGAVCVPLDPAQPAERLRQLLDDAAASVVVGSVPGFDCLDPALVAPLDEAPAVSLLRGQAAYLIYTSGSTGTPKGVLVSHDALAHYVSGVLHRLELPADASMAMVSTTAADLGHTVLFGALCSGRTLHLISRERGFDPDRFAEYMARHRVGVLKIVPSHLRGLLQGRQPADGLPERALILGGEATSAELARTVRDLKPHCRLFNHYGPTETTVGVLTHEAVTLPERQLPTGTPLPGSRVYVLDADLNPVPAGIVGELYIAGPQLARGYLDRPGLTAERFVPDPFTDGARMYRTGDRVRQDAQGRIEYLGRQDEQVKIRGYRVELGEIAHLLRSQPGVKDAAVIVHEERLVAYCVPQGTDTTTLKAELKAQLPDHMVPAQLIALDRLPVTPNGKLDRRALPAPVWETQGHVAPRNEIEALLAQVWQEVLGVEQVGIHDNFFDLGGHSLLVTRLAALVNARLSAAVPLRVYFESSTLAEMAASIEATNGNPNMREKAAEAEGWADMDAWLDTLETEA